MCLLCAAVLSCSHSRHNEESREREPNMVDVVLRFDFADQADAAAPAQSKSPADDLFNINVGSIAAPTKATANNLERKIQDLNLFFVRERHTGGSDANTVKHIYLTENQLTVNPDGSSGDIVIKDIYLGPYIMYMMANVGDLSKNGTVKFTPKQLNDFKFELPAASTGSAWLESGLPMYGKDRVDIEFVGDNIVPISGKLNFAVSKVNFKCKIKDELFGTGKIYISSVSLMNVAAHCNPFATTAPVVTPYSDNYAIKYSQSENRQSADGYFYAYPNGKGNVVSIGDPKERNISNAPVGATYLYVETTFINKSNDAENYGFYIYLGKENDLINFDTDIGKFYDINVNINGIDPSTDSRISSLIITMDLTDAGGQSMYKDSLCSYSFFINAQNLKGQDINLTMKAEPAAKYNKDGYISMVVMADNRHDTLNGPVTHFEQLVVLPFSKIDANSYSKKYYFGFVQHHDVPFANSQNYIVIDVEIANGVKSSAKSGQLWTPTPRPKP